MSGEVGPAIELLMVADWAEAVGGKLYVMGGGLTTLVVTEGASARFAVAALLAVPRDYHAVVTLSAHLEDGDRALIPGWALHEELALGGGSSSACSAALAGPVDVLCRASTEVVVRMRFGRDERCVRFDTVAEPPEPNLPDLSRPPARRNKPQPRPGPPSPVGSIRN